MESATSGPLSVFISYSHKDGELCQEFLTHLSQLEHDGLIEHWHDRRITAGTEWAGKIDEHLNSAHIIVLLVSADFLASSYCNDVEMTRALMRHDAGEARVIPAILRPSDWKTSRFAKLNALPADGKPVVDWKTHDHGFLNVVEGLRRVAEELLKRKSPPIPLPKPFCKARSWRLVVAAAVTALLIAAGWFWWAMQERYIAQGDGFLNVGRYAEALDPYQQALRLNPLSPQAKLGLKKVALANLRSTNPVAFGQQLKQLLQEAPKDPHLRVFEGDYLLSLNRPDDAKSRYQEAAKLNPRLAEAYFRLGVLYDKQGNSRLALQMYQRAVEVSPLSPHYRTNLADQHFKRGEYPQAIAEYGRLDRFPLAALESAKIHRLLGRLAEARELELIAMEWLEQSSVANLPENQWPWYFDVSQTQGVSLSGGNEKVCYARLALSATLYLKGDEGQATDHANRAAQACGSRSLDVKAVLRWELGRLADERRELAARAQAFGQKFLVE